MADPPEITIDMMNAVLAEASRDRGVCLCIHPFMNVINFYGTSCAWCEQPVPEHAVSPEMKQIRTQEIHTRRPEWVKDG